MHLALDFGCKALDAGYKVFFSSMNSLMHVLKTQEFFRASAARLKCIREFQILIVDKLGYPSVSKVEANLFLLISALYESISVVITSNKGFEGWADIIDDSILTSALLDRLTHRCQALSLSGNGRRVAHHEKYSTPSSRNTRDFYCLKYGDFCLQQQNADGASLGLTVDELAFYDALTKPQAIKDFYENTEPVALTKELADTLRKNKAIDWQNKESARAAMRKMIKRLLKSHRYPSVGMEDAISTVMLQCELWTDNAMSIWLSCRLQSYINQHKQNLFCAQMLQSP